MYFVSKLMNNGYGDIQEGFWRDKEVDLAVIEKVWSMDFASDMEEDEFCDQFAWNVLSKEEGAKNLAALTEKGLVVEWLPGGEELVGVGVDRAQLIEEMLRVMGTEPKC